MIKGPHKIAILIGISIFLGLFSLDMLPAPWKKQRNSVQQNEAQAAFLRASNLKPHQLRAARKPKSASSSLWGSF